MAPGASSPPQFKADHLGNEHGDGLAQHRRLGFDAAHAPSQDAQAVDHRGMGIRAHQGVRIGDAPAVAPAVEDHPAEVFQVDLVHDPRVRRHHLEVAERLLSPAQERIALSLLRSNSMALLRCSAPGVPKWSTCTEWSMTSSAGERGLMAAARPPSLTTASRNGRKIHDGGYAGEVLEYHARGG